MVQHSRQTLAAYGFFEDARRNNKYTQDALIPFVLPAIAGKAGDIFSAEQLAKDLAPMFGSALVRHLADSLIEPLLRAGYLKKEASGQQGSVYIYDSKTNEIPLSSSVSRAEEDMRIIGSALKEYVSEARVLKNIVVADDTLQFGFINWITKTDAPNLPGTTPEKIRLTAELNNEDSQSDQQLEILYSSFVTWAERERPSLFDKIRLFAELGLVVDLLSEIRVPTRKQKRVDLSVVFDSTVLLELLGLCGPTLQASSARLMRICKDYKIGTWTLSHLVDEVNAICYNVLHNPSEGFAGSVNDSVKRYPEVLDLVKSVHGNPDVAIKSLGINIVPYNTNIRDHSSTRLFDGDNIRDFTGFLNYDTSKPMMAKRDAWSLAYAVRRQNGAHTSNLYESRCVIVTRSPVFARKAREYLRSETNLYPSYAVTPVMELRHFSTMFMLAFGSDAAEKVIRAELVSSCEKIVRASPGLIEKIRTILQRMGTFSEDQLNAVLSDPITTAEFVLATGNDPSVITPQSGQALVAIVRDSAAKEERLRSLERERTMAAENERVVAEERAAAQFAIKKADEARLDAEQKAELARQEAEQKAAADGHRLEGLDRQADLAADILANDILAQVKLFSLLLVIIGFMAGTAIIMDMLKEYTGMPEGMRLATLIFVGVFAFYHLLAFFWPEIEPAVFREWVTRKLAERRLDQVTDSDLRARVWKRLPFSE